MIINKEEYLFHVSGEKELKSMKRVLDLIENTLNRHNVTYTDFFEPNLIELAKSILNRFEDIGYVIDGGFENAERQIISIFSWYYFYEENKDSHISPIEIKGNLDNIQHKDVLGSILGLGIVRDKVGDIGFFKNSIKVALSKDISDYVLFNLKKIKRENVEVKSIPINELGKIEEIGVYKDIIASSMRLDAIIGEAFNLSRSDSQKLVQSNLVKVNFKEESKASKSISENDLISVRGKGRFKISSIDGLTKKERIKLKIFYPE
ncbi:MAG: RNA-binding protein [Tissierellia bacterium]|nr:RNA-binding protein [Tissierellia bacterium]